MVNSFVNLDSKLWLTHLLKSIFFFFLEIKVNFKTDGKQ